MGEKWKPGLYCYHCQNTGEIDCRCGGDLCVCGLQEIPCPTCDGRSADPYDYDDEAPSDG